MENKVEWVPCPGDLSNQKVRGMALCRDCRRQFDREVGDAVLGGATPPTYEAWIMERVTGLLPELEKAARNASVELNTAKEETEKRLNEMLHEAVAGRTLAIDQLRAAKERLRETRAGEIWNSLEGNKAYREAKVSQARLAEARRLLKDLEAKKPAPAQTPEDEPAPAPNPSRQKAKTTEKGTKAKKVKEAREREASESEES